MGEQYAERNAKIVELRMQGVGPREIARRLDLSPNIVAGVMTRREIKESSAPINNRITDDVRRAGAVRSFLSSIRKAAAEYGVTRATMIAWRRKFPRAK